MAYAEKRGKGLRPWRVKYVGGDGQEHSESGFETKAVALDHGHDREAEVRQGRWIDPALGRRTLADWAKEWDEDNPVSGRSADSRRYRLGLLLPEFGDRELRSVTFYDVQSWAKREDKRRARVTVTGAVSQLSTILTAAADARLILANPISGRKLHLGHESAAKAVQTRKPRIAVTPTQVLDLYHQALADGIPRPGALMILVAAYGGLRWGEVAGLHKDRALVPTGEGPVIRIDPEKGALHEDDDGAVYLGEPKPPNGARDVLLPPFLAELLTEHLESWKYAYPFSGPRGGWWRRSNFGRKVMRPTADGWERPARRVRGHRPWDAAVYEPIVPGLDYHSLRHTHATWLEEDGIPMIAQTERLGHAPPAGVAGIYRHATPQMRGRIISALEERWEAALRERRRRDTGLRAV